MKTQILKEKLSNPFIRIMFNAIKVGIEMLLKEGFTKKQLLNFTKNIIEKQ